MSKKRLGRGRPKGSGEFDGGILRFAVSEKTLGQLLRLKKQEGLKTISQAARRAITIACENLQ